MSTASTVGLKRALRLLHEETERALKHHTEPGTDTNRALLRVCVALADLRSRVGT